RAEQTPRSGPGFASAPSDRATQVVRVVPGFDLIGVGLPVGGRRTTSTATASPRGARRTRGHRASPSGTARDAGCRAPDPVVSPRESARLREALGRLVRQSPGNIWRAVRAFR